jgi:L-histidine N-alpha-methyltransferase
VTITFASGELLRTEICTKYTRAGTGRMLADAGMAMVAWYSDAEERFGLALAR